MFVHYECIWVEVRVPIGRRTRPRHRASIGLAIVVRCGAIYILIAGPAFAGTGLLLRHCVLPWDRRGHAIGVSRAVTAWCFVRGELHRNAWDGHNMVTVEPLWYQ